MAEHVHPKDPLLYTIKRKLLGAPLNRHTLSHQRLSKRYGLGILSSDCISSSAYGSEQILIALLPVFGLAAFSMLMPMTAVVLVILIIVTLSYHNVISVYSKTGGAYFVSRRNFGPVVAQVAAVALILDYVVTLAIQSAAGIAAIVSTFPELAPWKVEMTLAVIVLLTYGNLRGVKEAGKAFALPTYFFVGSMAIVFTVGIYRDLTGTLPQLSTNVEGAVPIGSEQGLLTLAAIVTLLRAFANGGSSLTGLEAISDGVMLFKTPEHVNARRTLIVMSSILGTLVLGVSWFAHRIYALPYESGTPTVISQIAKAILGDGAIGNIFFILVQAATMLILFAGANTTFSAFPILVNFVASDGFLPRWLAKRGHRLNFSNGILVLVALASILVLVTQSSVEHLVAYYAIGVFTAFTLTGLGMAKHTHTHRGDKWRLRFGIHLLSGSISLIVVIIFAIVKFTAGAWVVILLGPIMVLGLIRVNKRYQSETGVLDITPQRGSSANITRHDVAVLIDNVDLATIGAIRYARSIKPRKLSAVHFVIDDRRAEEIREAWDKYSAFDGISLEFIDCPDRRLANAAIEYSLRETEAPDVELTLLLPRRSYSRFLGRLLHDQTAESIASAIAQLDRVVATIVPFDVEKILDGKVKLVPTTEDQLSTPELVSTPKPHFESPVYEPVGHHAKSATKIGEIQWRKRAEVVGRVTGIRVAPKKSSPLVEIEIWDETGGVRLQFIGRREIAGLEVGSTLRAEGMVGELDGKLTILNPSYEIVI
jgi:amino acid transporter